MAEMNAADVIEAMRDQGHISPHPTGRITKKATGVVVRAGPFRRKKFLYVWRLHTGQGRTDYRDFENVEDAEAAQVLMGL